MNLKKRFIPLTFIASINSRDQTDILKLNSIFQMNTRSSKRNRDSFEALEAGKDKTAESEHIGKDKEQNVAQIREVESLEALKDQKSDHDESDIQEESIFKDTPLNQYLSNLRRTKKTPAKKADVGDGKVVVSLKSMIQIDKGFVNLPKEAVIESIYHNTGIYLTFKYNSGTTSCFYYQCPIPDCNYNLKIYENKDSLKHITTAGLISSFKNLDISVHSGLETGMCALTVFGDHSNHPENTRIICKDLIDKKGGNIFLISLINAFNRHLLFPQDSYLSREVLSYKTSEL